MKKQILGLALTLVASAPFLARAANGPAINPVALYRPEPRYPAFVHGANMTGTVVLEILVGADGSVTSADILQSQPLFDRVALETVRQWRYQPVLVDGKPIVWKTKVTLNFGQH